MTVYALAERSNSLCDNGVEYSELYSLLESTLGNELALHVNVKATQRVNRSKSIQQSEVGHTWRNPRKG